MAEAPIRITASLLSGHSAEVLLQPSASVAELSEAAAAALGVPAGQRQRLVFAEGQVSDPSATASEAGLYDGACVDLVLCASPALMPCPGRFSMQLRSSRDRLLRERLRREGSQEPHCLRCSSAFTIMFALEVDMSESTLSVELWRKNDHDTFNINTQTGTLSGNRQHWMCGNQPFTKQLEVAEPMQDILDKWTEQLEPVLDEGERFWSLPPAEGSPDGQACTAEAASQRRRPRDSSEPDDFERSRPLAHPGMDGWFRAPSADCTELKVQAKLPFMRLSRVLIDAQGRPVRAAMLCGGTPLHDPVEEYDVELDPKGPDEEASEPSEDGAAGRA